PFPARACLLSSLRCHRPPLALHPSPPRRPSDLRPFQHARRTPVPAARSCVSTRRWPSAAASSSSSSVSRSSPSSGRPTAPVTSRSEEHTSELQSRFDLVCRLLLEKKNNIYHQDN